MKTVVAAATCCVLSLPMLLAPPAAASQEVPTLDASTPREAFHQMAEYLAGHGGKWRGENPNHDATNDRSPSHFGLWFEEVANGHGLELTIVAHFDDTTVVSSRGYWAWHPGREELLHWAVGRNGYYAEGVTDFPAEDTFRSTMRQFLPNGGTAPHRDSNVLVDEDTHTNVSYSQDEEGAWVAGTEWVWQRERS